MPVESPDADAGGRRHLVHPGGFAAEGKPIASCGKQRLSISGGVGPERADSHCSSESGTIVPNRRFFGTKISTLSNATPPPEIPPISHPAPLPPKPGSL